MNSFIRFNLFKFFAESFGCLVFAKILSTTRPVSYLKPTISIEKILYTKQTADFIDNLIDYFYNKFARISFFAKVFHNKVIVVVLKIIN